MNRADFLFYVSLAESVRLLGIHAGGVLVGGSDLTYREIVHVSLGGPLVRIVLTNEFGTEPLTIGAANVALSTGHGAIDPAVASTLTLSGNPSIIIPAGGMRPRRGLPPN